jgi:hypothetical protein
VLTDTWHPDAPGVERPASVTWSYAPGGLRGYAPGPDSVLAQGYTTWQWLAYDAARNRLLVGRPADNRVTILEVKPWPYRVPLPLVER